MVISVDTGNKQIKTANETFVAGIIEDTMQPGVGNNADYMWMDGKYYILSNTRGTYVRNKTQDDRYFYLTIMGIVKELDRRKESEEISNTEVVPITLLVGLPPAHYGDLKKDFQAYFKKDGKVIRVSYRGKAWNIAIKKVYVFAQGYAAIAPYMGKYSKYPKALLCDIGGFTADYMMINYGKPDMNIADSLEKGVIMLYQKIKKTCQSKYDVILEETDVDVILQDNEVALAMYPMDVIQEVEKVTKKFVQDFLGAFREYQIDLKTTYVIFIGGGSLLLRKYIEDSKLIGNHTFIEDVKANVEGYEKLYQVVANRKS